jgi:hypothetical protein
MIERYEQTQDNRLAPTTNIWCSLMLVYAESRMQDKAERVLHVIKRMEKAGNEMDIVAYNTLLKACAKTNTNNEQVRQRVLDISKRTVDILRRSKEFKPNSFTYNSLLWICDKMIQDPEEKRATIKALFESCCDDGEVNAALIGNLNKVAPRDLFFKLVGTYTDQGNYVDIKKLPTTWTRNARHNRRR